MTSAYRHSDAAWARLFGGGLRLVPATVLATVGLTGISAGTAAAAPGTATSVSVPKVSLSTPAAGAQGVTYTVGFSLSSTGAISANAGEISVVAPAGTVFPNNGGDFQITDNTHSADSSTYVNNLSLQQDGAAASFQAPNNLAAGDSITLTLYGVTNPAAGSRTLTVSTSSDTTAAISDPYTLTAVNSLTTPSVRLSGTAAGAQGVTYTVGFSLSSTGAITANQGQISIVAPAGTVFPNNGGDFQITDNTHSADSSTYVNNLSLQQNGAAASFQAPNNLAAGDSITLAISGVTNPAGGTDTLTVATSSDTPPATSSSYQISGTTGTQTSITDLSVTANDPTGGAPETNYTVSFTSTHGLAQNAGLVILDAPAGTVLPNGYPDAYCITDTTTGANGCSYPGANLLADDASVVSFPVPVTISAGDHVTVTFSGATNAPAATNPAWRVFTSSDTNPVTATGPALTSPQAISGLTVSANTPTGGAPSVNYSVGFTVSSTGGLWGGGGSQGTIALDAPAGTVLPNGYPDAYCVTDTTTGANGCSYPGANLLADDASVVSFPVPVTISAGDHVTVTFSGATNAPAATNPAWRVFTSSDTNPVTASGPTLTKAKAVSGLTVSASSVAPGATNVTYTVGFTVSSTGGLWGGSGSQGTISFLALPGTVLPNGYPDAYCVTDTTTGANGCSYPNVNLLPDGGSIATIAPGITVNPGNKLTVTIPGVTNPPAPTAALSIQPTTGTVGSTVKVTGSGFGPDETVHVYWNSTSSKPLLTKSVGMPMTVSTSSDTVAASVPATVTGQIKVPATVNGVYHVIAVGATTGRSASAPFTVKAAEKLKPSKGAPGADVADSLTGFLASGEISIYLGSTSGTPVATATPNATGSAAANFTIPASPGGRYTVTAMQSGGPTATATLTVTAGMTLSPASGTPGSSVTANLAGFGASQSVSIYFGSTSGTPVANTTTDSAGSASTSFSVPSGASTGNATVYAVATGGPTATAIFDVT